MCLNTKKVRTIRNVTHQLPMISTSNKFPTSNICHHSAFRVPNDLKFFIDKKIVAIVCLILFQCHEILHNQHNFSLQSYPHQIVTCNFASRAILAAHTSTKLVSALFHSTDKTVNISKYIKASPQPFYIYLHSSVRTDMPI